MYRNSCLSKHDNISNKITPKRHSSNCRVLYPKAPFASDDMQTFESECSVYFEPPQPLQTTSMTGEMVNDNTVTVTVLFSMYGFSYSNWFELLLGFIVS